ncbi:MAG: sugar ABC transporter substrate-binding protein [Limnochordales bacterium]|nr:sugar ABC transporter substrate-binding protein [Limnochordales bacterium]
MKASSLRRCVLVPLVVLVCSTPSFAKQVTIVHMDNWSGVLADAMRAIAAEFEKEHPDIKVEYVNPGYLADVWAKATVMVAGGTPPDVVAIHARNIGNAISSDFAMSLNELMKKDGIDLSKTLLPGVLDPATMDGKVFGVPKDFNPTYLAVNRDMLDEAGLPLPQLGWTAREFEEYAKKLVRKDGQGNIVRFAVPLGTVQLNSWAFINGSRMYDRNKKKLELTSPSFLSALEWMAGLVRLGLMSQQHGTVEGFAKGDYAFSDQAWLTNVPMIAELARFRWATVYFPRGDAPPPTFVTNHWWVIPKATKHPREAWEWLKYLHTSPKALEIRAQYAIIPGALDSVKRLVELAQVPSGSTRSEIYGPFLRPTDYLVSEPADAAFQYAAGKTRLWDVIYSALRGEKDVRRAMAEIEPAMYAAMAEVAKK